MHLVSRVVGELRHDLDLPLHAYRACADVGLQAARRKVRAMQLIADAEGQRRGIWRRGRLLHRPRRSGHLYCYPLALVENGIATVQAGAGITCWTCSAVTSHDETRNKARAVLRAIATTHACTGDLLMADILLLDRKMRLVYTERQISYGPAVAAW